MKTLVSLLPVTMAFALELLAGQPVFKCDLKALQPEERKRHDQLTRELRSAAVRRRGIPNGYAFQMDPAKLSITDAAEWIALERKCCPFFDYRIDLLSEENVLWFTLTGPDGVKKFVEMEVPWALDSKP